MKNRKILAVSFLSSLLIFSTQAFPAESPTLKNSKITMSIKAKLMANGISGVDVSTNDSGIVSLRGKVDSETQASTVYMIAESTDGVIDIENKGLNVKGSKHPLDDTLITAKVKGSFIKANLIDGKDVSASSIKVETNNNVVYLSGYAKTQSEKNTAIKLAESIKDVKKVDSSSLGVGSNV